MRALPFAAALLAALLVFTPTARAQGGAGAGAGGRGNMQERRAEMREKLRNMSPEERKAALDKAKERREERRANLTPEQRAWAEAMAAETRKVREGMKAGTLTRESAAQQLKAWRQANPRPTGGSGD